MIVDYTRASILLRARKALRYVRLYGWSRTLIKIQGQYHMKAVVGFEGANWSNPDCVAPDGPERDVAVIGCGNYAFSNIAYYLKRRNPRFLRAAYDSERCRALSLCKEYGGAIAVSDWRTILVDPQVKIVFIASNHASHAEYAVACIEAGKHVHIEKPHVVNRVQLERMIAAMRRNPRSKVFLGFNRPRSHLFKRLQREMTVCDGPLMINWFVVGHEIPEGHWYFDGAEGGRVLGNLCHWTDLSLQMVGLDRAFPCTIVSSTPVGEKSDCVVSIMFADRSCAAITFSAKGYSFEGVREALNVHKGDVIANLTDFQTLHVEVVETKKTIRSCHRDHGHEANIVNSYVNATSIDGVAENATYVAATAKLYLAVRDAVDSGCVVTVSPDLISDSLR